MKIESIIRRANGTIIEFDDRTYHFLPTPTDDRHQADVDVEAHIKRLLSIPEGFRSLDGAIPSRLQPERHTVSIAGSQVHSAQYALSTGEIISLEELTSRSFKASGLSISEWNDLADEDRYEHIDATLIEIEADAAAGAKPPFYAPPEDEGDEEPKIVVDQPTLTPTEGEPDPKPAAAVAEERKAEQEADEEEATEDRTQEGEATADGSDEQKGKEAPKPAGELDRDALAIEFEKKFGRKPNGKLSARSIQKALEED